MWPIKINWQLIIRSRCWFGWYYSTMDTVTWTGTGRWRYDYMTVWRTVEETEDLIATPWHNCFKRQ